MAWSWSHSQEAYENARENLSELDKETLEIIFAEWRAAQGKGGIIHDHNHFVAAIACHSVHRLSLKMKSSKTWNWKMNKTPA